MRINLINLLKENRNNTFDNVNNNTSNHNGSGCSNTNSNNNIVLLYSIKTI